MKPQDMGELQHKQFSGMNPSRPTPIPVPKEGYVALANEVAAIEDGQDFGWLDTILNLYRRDIERNYGGRTIGKTLNGEESKTAIQARFTAQEELREAADKYCIGRLKMMENRAKTQAKQHQAELLRARIDEIEYPATVRAYEAGFGASEYESFLTKEERARCKKLQAELDKLEGVK